MRDASSGDDVDETSGEDVLQKPATVTTWMCGKTATCYYPLDNAFISFYWKMASGEMGARTAMPPFGPTEQAPKCESRVSAIPRLPAKSCGEHFRAFLTLWNLGIVTALRISLEPIE